MKTLYIECAMGAAGDMLTAALLELMPDKEAALAKLNAMGIPGVVFEAKPSEKCGITGTDAGAILGLNPYRSAFQVYHDKISDTIENIDNEAMRQGRDLEDYVAQRFSEETGFKVRRANAIYQSEEHPLLLADFDRLIVGQKAGLECKTVSPFSADKWADGKIPAHYLAQVDHYLAVSGFDCWYVAALIFGRELVIHKIVTDKQVLSDLIDKEELFWTNHVVPQMKSLFYYLHSMLIHLVETGL